MPQPVVYQGDLKALLQEWKRDKRKRIANGQCARLPQELTSVGHTSGWMRGPRVIDSPNLRPGTVIANFKLVNGIPRFPNQVGWHAGLFHRFEGGRVMVNGFPCVFSMIDQWPKKPPGERGLAILTHAFAKEFPKRYKPANMADEYYVVLVK